MLLLTYGGSKSSPVARWEDDSCLVLSCVLPPWLLHTLSHPPIEMSSFSLSSFQFHHLFSITGALWAGPPASKSPEQPGSMIKFPRHFSIMEQWYEVMLGVTKTYTHTHSLPSSCTCKDQGMHIQTVYTKAHKAVFTPPCFLIELFQCAVRELHVLISHTNVWECSSHW